MSIDIGHNLKLICDVITEQCTKSKILLERTELLELCSTANAIESYIIAKKFSSAPWNIGSLYVLSILQELRILTATEYILSLQNSTDIQLILNDFLEDEHHLLCNLFINSYYGSSHAIRLTSILDDCLSSLYKDIMSNPDLSDLKYLKPLRAQLPTELLLQVSQKHLTIVLELHTSNVRDAFRNFSKWINEGVDNITFTKIMHEHLIVGQEQDVLNYLFKVSTRESFNEWKFYLIFLQTIASKSVHTTGPFIRKYLQTRLQNISLNPCKEAILHLLLTARAATAITMEVEKNIDAYANWYKQNIGEMKISFKAEEFKNIMSLLEESLAYELEEDYLEVHSMISISPPVLCGKIVQGYKAKCKLRLSQLKRDAKSSKDVDESILIEDSD